MMDSSGNPIAMPLVLIEPHVDFYDYHNKYTKGATTYTCPAPFDECLTKALQEEAVKAIRPLAAVGSPALMKWLTQKATSSALK